MRNDGLMTRRSVVLGGSTALAALFAGGVARTPRGAAAAGDPLWQRAYAKGLVYGSSTATWQVEPDPAYSALFKREAGILFTEDDLLWYQLKPSPGAPLNFSTGDRIIGATRCSRPCRRR